MARGLNKYAMRAAQDRAGSREALEATWAAEKLRKLACKAAVKGTTEAQQPPWPDWMLRPELLPKRPPGVRD